MTLMQPSDSTEVLRKIFGEARAEAQTVAIAYQPPVMIEPQPRVLYDYDPFENVSKGWAG